ncbi:AAA family ATPase [Streptococcus constellatus]|uniref:AAA family ATPase n=1 Tax=Streptococcus constellatus TaxID=76860 RepID=UPI00255781D8|nr:ATP-binding protein [Streptococcus constellatus]MDK6972333.1 ATP-binding protein [Streptococcus constellatus]
MLVDFEVTNFLSFRESSVLSLEKGKYLKKHAKSHVFEKQNIFLLKNINIFGANGSGKSNLITALRVFAKMVVEPTDDIEDSLPYMPFRLNEQSKYNDTEFSIKLIKNEKIYRYHICYNSEEVTLEELYIISRNDEEKIYFKRTNSLDDSEILPDNLQGLRQSVRKNKLLLFEGQDKNDAECVAVFQWFHSNLIFESSSKHLFKLIQTDSVKKDLFIKLLNLADFNIIDIDVIEKIESIPEELKKMMSMMNSDERPLPKQITTLEVYSIYKKYDENGKVIGNEKIAYDMESSGTQKMMSVALTLLNSLHKDRIIVMDEFDDSFHLSLTKALLNIINSESNMNQFIFTTHNLNLLDSDLRVDQIYLTEKDFLGRTDLFSLFDFNDINGVSRSDISFIRRYLNGQFGALPDIDVEGMNKLFKEI